MIGFKRQLTNLGEKVDRTGPKAEEFHNSIERIKDVDPIFTHACICKKFGQKLGSVSLRTCW